MSYEKNTWVNGDIITAEKLNHLEGGVQDAYPFIVQYAEEFTLDKSFRDILEAVQNGMIPFIISLGEDDFVIEPITSANIDPDDNKYKVTTEKNVSFKADTDTDPLVEED